MKINNKFKFFKWNFFFYKKYVTNLLLLNDIYLRYVIGMLHSVMPFFCTPTSGLPIVFFFIVIGKLFVFYIVYLFYRIVIYCRCYLAYILHNRYIKYIEKLWFYEILCRHTLFYDISYTPKTLVLQSFFWFFFVSIILFICYFWNMWAVGFWFFIFSNYIYLVFCLKYLFAVNYCVKQLIREEYTLAVENPSPNASKFWHAFSQGEEEILALMICFIQHFCFGYILIVTCLNAWFCYNVMTWTHIWDFNSLTEFLIFVWGVLLNSVFSIDISNFYNIATSIKLKIINFCGVDVIIGQENASFFNTYVIERSSILFFGFMFLFIGYIIQEIKNFKVDFWQF